MVVNDEEAIGIPLDAYIPELRIAFLFPYKNTQREKDTMTVVKYLCEKRNIACEVISAKQGTDLCEAVKRGFRKVHIYLATDSVKDIAVVRANYEQWRHAKKYREERY